MSSIDNWTNKNRRDFLSFMGRNAVVAGIMPSISSPLFANAPSSQLKAIGPSYDDTVKLSEGLKYNVLATWGDKLNPKEAFGFNNDYIAFVPLRDKSDEAILWVNHESPSSLFISGTKNPKKKTKQNIIDEQNSVGGSLLKIKKDSKGVWQLTPNSPYNKRLTAKTVIPFSNNEEIAGKTKAVGTLANCAGGITPWGNVLSCEENYHNFYGEVVFDKNNKRSVISQDKVGWQRFFTYPPEHYGWVVEVDPLTGKAQKHVQMGRFAHEGAAVTEAKDGRIVVYMGDDANDRCFYKFISAKKNSLSKGTLYVADTIRGIWIPLDREKNPMLKKHFKTQLDVMIRTREAAELVGGTKLDRPEDTEVDPNNPGHIYLTLTNNKPKGNYFGYIAKVVEENNDPLSMKFDFSTFVAGGSTSALACPDNLAFDPKGNLWVTTDISGSQIGKAPYKAFGNNALFCIPLKGPKAGIPIRVVSAPNGAELTGPMFSPDGKELFLSVQHPGEGTTSLKNPLSTWSTKGDGVPRPAIITISGRNLDKV